MSSPLHRLVLHRVAFALMLATVALVPAPLRAQQSSPASIDLTAIGKGPSPFPAVWRPYRQQPLPPVDLRNGEELTRDLSQPTLRLSLKEFLKLVVENDLDLLAARYKTAIAEVDVLRAKSGQAARGITDAPLPGSLFAGAIGAGVSSTAALSAGGTGGAAISTQGKLVAFGPRGVFDPTFSANVSYDHLVSPLNTTLVAGAAQVTVPSTVLQTRFQQALPFGTSYSISFNLQRQMSTQAGLLFNPALTSFYAAQVYQPLLNGFGIAFNRRFVTVADNNRQIVAESYRSALNDTLSSAADDYWDLIALRENVQVAAQTVATAERQYEEYRERQELDDATPLDVLGAESRLASSRLTLLTAQTREQQQEALIKTLISKASDPALDRTSIETTDQLPEPAADDVEPLSTSLATALGNRSAIRQASLALKNQRIAEDFTRKNLLPTLSVYAAYDGFGLNAGATAAVRQLWRAAFPEYSFGVTLSIPVFNRAAQADGMRAEFERQSAEAALQRTKSQIELQVKTAAVSLQQGRSSIAAAARAVDASRVAYEGAQGKLELGVFTAYQVMLAERDLRTAESAEIQARADYAKALVADDVAVGRFLSRNGIRFEDALRGQLLSGSTAASEAK
ncbi:MAG TPA: TolC family protein [Vicinamibacterales bacterium]|jgi:outer membrane protein TolC